MISVVIATRDNERDLVECLTPLVQASVEGLIRELVAADAGSSDATLEILDEAGAVLAGGGLAGACAAAKGPWLLIVEPTSRLGYDWLGPVRRHLERGSTQPIKLARRGLFAKTEAVLALKRDYKPGRLSGARTVRI